MIRGAREKKTSPPRGQGRVTVEPPVHRARQEILPVGRPETASRDCGLTERLWTMRDMTYPGVDLEIIEEFLREMDSNSGARTPAPLALPGPPPPPQGSDIARLGTTATARGAQPVLVPRGACPQPSSAFSQPKSCTAATASSMSCQGSSSRNGCSRGAMPVRPGPVLRHHRDTEHLEMYLDAPKCVIVEQPKERGMRFRYECEGRSAGSILGASSTETNKTLPTVEIQGDLKHIKKVKIIVSLVTKDIPHRPHPHSLVGKDCSDGICIVLLNPRTHKKHSFTNLGIQCVRRKELDAALEKRRKQKIDPFNTDHSKSIEDIDMNVVRLCFQCQLEREDGEKIHLNPVVSNAIFDKKATTTSELKINRLNLDNGPCTGKTEIYLLCDKVQKDDIEIIFGRGSWEAKAEFAQTDVHRQIAIVFKSPPYQEQDITEKVEVNVFLRRISDHMDSEPVKFTYLPHNPDPYEVNRKRKIKTDLKFKERCSVTPVQHPAEGSASHQFDPFGFAQPEPSYTVPDPLQEGLLSRPSQPLGEIHYSNPIDCKQEDNIFSGFEMNSEDFQFLYRTLTQSIEDPTFSTFSVTSSLDPQLQQSYSFSDSVFEQHQTDLDHTTNLSLTNMDQNFNIPLDNRLDLEFYNDVQFNQLTNGNHVAPLEALPQDPTGPTSQGLSLVKTESHAETLGDDQEGTVKV